MESKQTINNRINSSIVEKTLISLIILLPSICSALPTALTTELPVEFDATYTLETYGLAVAKATYSLKHESNGLKFTQYSEPIGLASLFKKETLQETSYLSLHKNQLLLDQYLHVQKGSNKNRDADIKIDWIVSDKKISGRIRGTAMGDPVQLEVNRPIWDTLSFQLPIMMGTTDKTSDWETTLLTKGELRNYTFVVHGIEHITVSGNDLMTIKVERKSRSNKPVFFWIAPDLLNLPVKIEKWKDGSASIIMFLDTATFPSKRNIQFKSIEVFDDL